MAYQNKECSKDYQTNERLRTLIARECYARGIDSEKLRAMAKATGKGTWPKSVILNIIAARLGVRFQGLLNPFDVTPYLLKSEPLTHPDQKKRIAKTFAQSWHIIYLYSGQVEWQSATACGVLVQEPNPTNAIALASPAAVELKQQYCAVCLRRHLKAVNALKS